MYSGMVRTARKEGFEEIADWLNLIPGIDLQIIERCSGHGGAWGYRTANFSTAPRPRVRPHRSSSFIFPSHQRRAPHSALRVRK